MGLILRCTECSASARRGVRRGAMCRMEFRDSHACTPHFEFLGEGDRKTSITPPVAPPSAVRKSFRGWRASVRFPNCHGLQGMVAHTLLCGSVRQPADDVRAVEVAYPGTATREPVAATNESDTGRKRATDGDPHAASISAASAPLFRPPLPPTRLHMRETATQPTTTFRRYT